LRATLDWSHDLLGAEERTVLRRCAAFAGGFTIEGARAVAGEPGSGETPIADLLASLVARSLLGVSLQAGATRYGMLETTRAYALEQLETSGEAATTRRRHAQHCLNKMRRASQDWLRWPDARWHEAYVVELDNVRAALDWAAAEGGDAVIAIALAGASGPLWPALSLVTEGIERLRAAIDREAANDSIEECAPLWFWYSELTEGESVESLGAAGRAVDLYRLLDDPEGLGLALSRQGWLLARKGQLGAASIAFSDALAVLRGAQSSKAMGFYWANVAFLHKCKGDAVAARACYERAIVLHREAGADRAVMVSIGSLADVAWAQGDLQGSAAALRQNIELLRRVNPRSGSLGLCLCRLSGVLTEQGELDEALAAAREGLPWRREAGFAWGAMDHFALRVALAGNIASAARLAGYADAAFARRQLPRLPNEARAHARVRQLLIEGLSAEELEGLRAQGAALGEEAACRLATES
jgi:tetratricopeptide (TPR) repeat protein